MHSQIFKKTLYTVRIKYKRNTGKCNLYAHKTLPGVLCGSDPYRDNLTVEDFAVGELS